MKSKKIIILTAVAAIIACSKPVFAQEAANTNNALASTSVVGATQSDTTKISKEQAKQITKDAFKNFFDITLDDSDSNININSNRGYYPGKTGKSYWDVSFNIDNGNYHCGGHASIDKNTGKIVNLYNYLDSMTDTSTKAVATITEDQAKATAEAFVSKISPEEFKSTKLIENKKVGSLKNQSFNFSYTRLDNNIPVYGDSIYVAVDRYTGKVSSYSIQWTDNLNLPSKDGIIDEKKGTDLVSQNTKMSLTYIPSTDPLNPEIDNGTKLVYTNDSDASNIIDAKTGEVLSIDKLTGRKIKFKDISTEQKEKIYNSSQSAQNSNKAVTSDEAEKIAQAKLKLLFNEDFTVKSSGYGERSSGINGNRIKTWNTSFVIKNSSDINNNGNVSINASNGEILDMHRYNEFPDNIEEQFQPKLTSDQAYDKAIQIISKLYPEKIKEIDTKQNIIDLSSTTGSSYTQPNLGFNFRRLVNGLPYKYDGINLSFSTKTGELLDLNCDWEASLSAPNASNVISTDDAKKVFLSKNIPELIYMLIPKDSSSQTNEKEVKLVYSINNNLNYDGSIYVDAFTGKILNYLGQDLDDNFSSFQNAIKGSSVEKEATILASNGIIDTKDFKLNGTITNLQFIKILTNIKNFNTYYGRIDNMDLKISTTIAKDSADYKYLQLAVNAGIIDNSGEFKPSDLVTREQASMYLVKLLHYDKIGKMKDAFNFQPADKSSISPGYVGYVALAKTLGLLDVDSNNNIRPKDKITMEEMVKSIYNTLQ